MLSRIENYRQEINALCRRYGVKRLELFGSATSANFNTHKSDLDFLVLYDDRKHGGAADRYLGLLEDLQNLFGRRVDLVDIKAARNPFFIANALKHRVMLYAA